VDREQAAGRRRQASDKATEGQGRDQTHIVLLALKRLVESLSGSSLGVLEEHPRTVLAELKPLLDSFDRAQDRLY
jgi:hypothetical protein